MFSSCQIRSFSVLGIIATALTSASVVTASPERSFFRKSPRLLKVMTTYGEVSVRVAKYYITIDLPEDAGQSLGNVTISQRQGFQQFVFIPDETFAFIGTRNQRGEAINISRVDYNPRNKNTISITFDPPIPPGNTFTLGLKPESNPDYDGIYLLGITAYPVGEKPEGLYLGVGRLTFYRSGNSW